MRGDVDLAAGGAVLADSCRCRIVFALDDGMGATGNSDGAGSG